jgi:hypothetical protein
MIDLLLALLPHIPGSSEDENGVEPEDEDEDEDIDVVWVEVEDVEKVDTRALINIYLDYIRRA